MGSGRATHRGVAEAPVEAQEGGDMTEVYNSTVPEQKEEQNEDVGTYLINGGMPGYRNRTKRRLQISKKASMMKKRSKHQLRQEMLH